MGAVNCGLRCRTPEVWVSGAGCIAAFTYLLHVCTVFRKGLEACMCCLLTVIYTSVGVGESYLAGGRAALLLWDDTLQCVWCEGGFCAGH